VNTIQGLTDKPKQTTTIVLDDGTKVTLALEYRPQQLGWFYDLTWEEFTLNGRRLVASPNIVRDFRNLIPFGISVLTAGAVEPLNQGDFVDGTVTLILLDADEVEEVEAAIFPGF
jgi:hypothetical protein